MTNEEQPVFYAVELTDSARTDLSRVTAFLRTHWDAATTTDFLVKLTQRLEMLTLFPLMGAVAMHYPGLRRVVITRRASLYYRVRSQRVEVVVIRDTREASSPR